MSSVVEQIRQHRATAILRAGDASLAAAVMHAAVAGGFRLVEFTLTTPGAYELITEFSRLRGLSPSGGLDEVVVGAGTVLTVAQAERAVAAGARFLVSPIADPEIIAAARAAGVASIPGVHTPTEMVMAHRAGAPLLKLYPAPAGGPAYLRAVRGPLPFLRIVPTNGVDLDNVGAWLRAGAWGVGFVASLFTPEDLAARNVAAIEARARAIRAAVEAVREPPPTLGPDPFAS
jgi:Entner-Doudoroff aldolase